MEGTRDHQRDSEICAQGLWYSVEGLELGEVQYVRLSLGALPVQTIVGFHDSVVLCPLGSALLRHCHCWRLLWFLLSAAKPFAAPASPGQCLG